VKRFFVFALCLAMILVAMPVIAAGQDTGPPGIALANAAITADNYTAPQASPAILEATVSAGIDALATFIAIVASCVAVLALLYYYKNPGKMPTLADFSIGVRFNLRDRVQALARDQA
jgi:hypothetical protein